MKRISQIVLAAAVLATGTLGALAVAGDEAKEAPGLKAGAHAPDALLRTIENESVEFSSLYAGQPLVVVFYRGGWCPYCTKSLEGWDARMGDIETMGAKFVAITPEKPEYTQKTEHDKAPGMTILSDPSGELAKKFGLLFSLDDGTKTRYKGYGIDLGERNMDGQWNLPHPGTFIIDTQGVIRFASVNPDYRVRPSPDEVIPELRKITKGE